MAWGDGLTLLDRFVGAREAITGMFPSRRRVGETYQGFVKQLQQLGSRLLEPIMECLRGQLRRIAQEKGYWTREGFVAFAVDGSRIDAPRTAANEQALGCGGRDKTTPQFWLTTLWHMGTGLPWAWKSGPSTDAERTHLRQMLDLLPGNALLVADAGFVGYELLNEILSGGRSFLVRVGANVHLLKNLGYAEVENDGTVYLWPTKAQSGKQPPLTLRLIVHQRGKKRRYLLTNLGEEKLSRRQTEVLYEMRWGVEIFFRSLKQTLARRKMLSRAPKQAAAELAWTMIGLQLLGLMSVEQIIKSGKDPLSWSVATSLRAIRRTMQDRKPSQSRSLLTTLSLSVKDNYKRKSRKRARNWPHKKTQSPPGVPKIRKANEMEIQKAKGIKDKKMAA